MLTRVYRLVNLLNLDVAIGAVITALFFSKQLGVPPHIYSILTLGLGVWIIYTLDRLLDVQKINTPPASKRHGFHQQHKKQLWIAMLFVVLLVVGQVYFLPATVFIKGLCLSAIVVIYVLLQRKLFIKEFVVALLYTLGVLLPSWALQPVLSPLQALLIIQLFVIALINLLLFSWFEFAADQKDGHASFATRLGKTRTAKLLVALCVVNFIISGWILTQYQFSVSIFVLFAMTIALLIIYLKAEFFANKDRYRLLGDAIFFIPLLDLFQ